MRQMKCPRCAALIPVDDQAAEVRCPACQSEYRIRKNIGPSPATPPARPAAPPAHAAGGWPGGAARPAVHPVVPPLADQPAMPNPPPGAVISPTMSAMRYSAHQRGKRQTAAAIVGIVVLLLAAGGGVFALVHLQGKVAPKPAEKQVIKQTDKDHKPVVTGSQSGHGATAGEQVGGEVRIPKITSGESPVQDPPDTDDAGSTPDNTTPDGTTPADTPAGGTTSVKPSVTGNGALVFSSQIRLEHDSNDPSKVYLSGSVTSKESRIVQMAKVRVQFYNAAGEIYRRDAEELSEDLDFNVAVLPPNEAVPFFVAFDGVSTAGFALDKTTFEVAEGSIVLADERCKAVRVSGIDMIRGKDGQPDVIVCKVTNPHDAELMNVMVYVDVYDRQGRPAGRVNKPLDNTEIPAGATVPAKLKVAEPIILQRLEFSGRGYGQLVGR